MRKEKRVLIVDDEPLVLEILSEMLSSAAKVFLAQTEHEALKIINTEDLDAVLCDITLGRSNGLVLLEKCRSKQIKVPFVMITGDITDVKKQFAFGLGASDILEKPIFMDYFETKFTRVLDEGYSIRKISKELSQVYSLVGKSQSEEGKMDFVKDYLATVESKRSKKKVS